MDFIPLKQVLTVFCLGGSVSVLVLALKMFLFPAAKLPEAPEPQAQVTAVATDHEPLSLTAEAQEAKERAFELRTKVQRLARKEAEEAEKEALAADKVAKEKEAQAAEEIASMEQLIAASKTRLSYQPLPRRKESLDRPKTVEKEAVQPPAKEAVTETVKEEPQPPPPAFKEYDPKEKKKQ